MTSRLLLFVIVCFVSLGAFAQSLTVTSIQIADDGTVSFTAQVTAKINQRERYQLSVYSSVDNYQQAYIFDGVELSPATPYDLSFNGNAIVGEYSGNIQFRFSINATVFPITFTDNTSSKLKIGKEYTVEWDDFHSKGTYKIELLRNGSTYQILQRSYAGTSYSGILPESIVKGDNYQLKVTPVSDESLASEPYGVSVGKPVGLAVKIAPIIAAGGGAAAYFLVGGSGGGGGGNNPGGGGGDGDFPPTPGTPGGG